MSASSTVEAAQVPLLRTKLYIPRVRHDQVSRPRLIERLDAGLERKLTLISAPAGFGKTTLVTEWVGALESFAAWVSLDKADNDPTRFLTYIVAALQHAATQTAEAGFARGLLTALQSPQPPPPEAVLVTLINEMAVLAHPMVLVLDDYHLIEDPRVHDALSFLLDHMPPQLHLVVATRDDPQLPLARLRARGQLTELRAADLRFTASEVGTFLNAVMGLDLSRDEVAALESRTEGWIAGLQLAAISMQGRNDVAGFVQSFAGSHRFVLDYLLEEVLEQQPEAVQRFLLQTAILDRLTGPLCDALRSGGAQSPDQSEQPGGSDGPAPLQSSAATLEMLERANMFIVPLDDERRWYRYHHLFSDLIRQRLHQMQADRIPVLHLRASEWYELNGYPDDAIEHALRAEDYERAASLIDERADGYWLRGEHIKLGGWLAGLPREWFAAKPQLCIYSAWMLFSIGQRDTAEQIVSVAEQSLARRTRDGLVDTGSIRLRGRLAAIRALMGSWWEDVPGIVRHARQAMEDLPKRDPWYGPAAIALGDAYELQGDSEAAYQVRLDAAKACKAAGDIVFHMIANLKVATSLRARGQLRQTIAVCQQQIRYADENGMSQSPMAGCFLAQWGEVLSERNDLDAALERAEKGVALTKGGDLALFGFGCLCLVRVLLSRGDLAGAEETLAGLETLAREHDLPPFVTGPVAVWRATLWLRKGEVEAAAQWADTLALDADAGRALKPTMEVLLRVRVLLAQGRPSEAAGLVQRLIDPAISGDRTPIAIEVLNLQALAHQALGEPAAAIEALGRALALAKPEGFVRLFVEEGPPMAGLLYEALGHGLAPEHVRRLLAVFPVAEAEQTAPRTAQAPGQALIEPLSERELEILGLIAEGMTNPNIAERLFLALNTVKAHTRNIYGKLGVHSRTQAVARARALGILDST